MSTGEPGGANATDPGRAGETAAMRTLFYDQTTERELHVVVSADNMRVYLKLVPGEHYTGITRDGIIALIAGTGVTHGLIGPGIDLFVATQNSATPFRGFHQVARGEPMRRGENGSIEFHVQPSGSNARYDETEAGTVDYKQPNLIENCFAGQRVATILAPGPGRPGQDVFGRVIPAVAGRPAKVIPGPGVVAAENGRDFSSEIEGRLVFEDDVLSVSPVLEIARDVDYAVGNVDFVGRVLVNGSLLDGFYINAKRGVELRGDMGAARISSEGDVTIAGGIKGKNAAIITCRSLNVRYIDDASVEASGDVTAAKEIMNSSVKALGRVTVTSGAIIGGDVCGFQGVEADTLGSEMGVPTMVMAGLNWTEENRKAEIRGKIAEYQDRIQSAKVLLSPLLEDKEITARLGSEHKSMLSELISELRDIRSHLVELLDERAGIDGKEQVGMVNQINVRKRLHMGVSIRFSAAESEIKDDVKGPVTVTQEEAAASIRTGAMTPFPKRKEDEPADVPGVAAPAGDEADAGDAPATAGEPEAGAGAP